MDASDKDFAEAMTLSGSKVELTHDLGEEIDKIVAGRILSMEHHPNSDHMWGVPPGRGGALPHPDRHPAPGTSTWGTWSPWPWDGASLPGGKKIEKGVLRGIESNGMMCGLYELGLDERDFPYAAITPAALLNDYHPPGPGQALHPRGHSARGQGVRARGVRPGWRR